MKVFETKVDEVLSNLLEDVSRTDCWNFWIEVFFRSLPMNSRISFVVAVFNDFETDDWVSSDISENVLRKCHLTYETDFRFINEKLVLVKSI